MAATIRALEASDDRNRFSSGNVDLDRFFQRFAGQNQFRHHIGTTYVAVDASGDIVGFAAVSGGELTTARVSKALAKKLPGYPLPVLRLARLAVAQNVQGQGIGGELMRAVFLIAHTMAETMGCVGVVVDAKADALGFYEQFGFIEVQAESGHLGDRPKPMLMFLELGAILKP